MQTENNYQQNDQDNDLVSSIPGGTTPGNENEPDPDSEEYKDAEYDIEDDTYKTDEDDDDLGMDDDDEDAIGTEDEENL